MAATKSITVPPPKTGIVEVDIEGTSPLIVHKWSSKAVKQMLDKQMGKARGQKSKKDPRKDYEEARYRLPDGRDGFKAVAFKAAMVGACRTVDGLPMTLARQIFFVWGDDWDEEQNNLVPIRFEQFQVVKGKQGKDGHLLKDTTKVLTEPMVRQDMVRLETGVADIRFRPMYPEWETTLTIEYNSEILSLEMVLNLLMRAGLYCGVGEWRPSSPRSFTGMMGRFRICDREDAVRILQHEVPGDTAEEAKG